MPATCSWLCATIFSVTSALSGEITQKLPLNHDNGNTEGGLPNPFMTGGNA